jgi:hypothetical protein
MTPAAKGAGRLVALIAKWRGEKDGSGTPWAANYNGALEACAKDLEKALSTLSLAEPGEAVAWTCADDLSLLVRDDFIKVWADGPRRAYPIPLYTHPAAPVGVSEWSPIESAPKDGTPILAFWQPLAAWPWNEDGSNYAVAAFRDSQWRPAGDDDDTEWGTPKFWRPLPSPPALQEPRKP